MRVNVDEAGRDVFAGGVNHARGLRIWQVADADDAAVRHRDVGGEPGVAGAVEHSAIENQQVVAWSGLSSEPGSKSGSHYARRQRKRRFHLAMVRYGGV